MSAALSHFLGEHEGLVAKFIRSAEGLCGYPSEDVRILSEISAAVKAKISQLGLDPSDTTNKELYYTLRAKAEKDSQAFAKICGLDEPGDLTDSLMGMFKHANKSSIVYGLKKNGARNLLRNQPPKQLMKKLKYRSVDSMVKREDISALFSAAFQIESSLWRTKFSRELKKVTANDFEERNLEVAKLPPELSAVVPNDITICYLLGSLTLKNPEKAGLNTLGLSLSLIEASDKIEAWSHGAKLKQLSPDFGKYISSYTDRMPASAKFFGALPINLHKLRGRASAVEKLADISLPLAWWRDSEVLARRGKIKPISLNLHDILNDHSQGKNFTSRATTGFQMALRHKLVERYLSHPSFRSAVLNELSPEEAMAPEASPVEVDISHLAGVA